MVCSFILGQRLHPTSVKTAVKSDQWYSTKSIRYSILLVLKMYHLMSCDTVFANLCMKLNIVSNFYPITSHVLSNSTCCGKISCVQVLLLGEQALFS